MTSRILVIGGYGNFGSFISGSLAREPDIQVVVGGRSIAKAKELVAELDAVNIPEAVAIDIDADLEQSLQEIKPNIVIHTSGPFQDQGYVVAQACIEQGCHYIDLADGRDFVGGINTLDRSAKENAVLVISGASAVPCLTSALLDSYKDEYSELGTLSYGITTAQKTTRGLATTAAILGYTGQTFSTLIDGEETEIYGWQGLHSRKFETLGRRFLANCDVPDLSLFPERYPTLKTIRFYAGLEIPLVHITLWLLSWFVRIGIVKSLQPLAPFLLRLSFLFDWFGTDKSGFYMELAGKSKDGLEKNTIFELTACSGDGPYIPCMPSILLARKLARAEIDETGAYPCLGFISREEYLGSLQAMDISWCER